MKRRTKIFCTLGPASSSLVVLRHMIQSGLDVARLNFSHGDHSSHLQFINKIRYLNKRLKVDIKILQDLEGYRIRIGVLKEPLTLRTHQTIYLVNHQHYRKGSRTIPLDFSEDIQVIAKGLDIFIDDGRIQLKVIGHKDNKLKARVIVGGILKSRKGLNIPGIQLHDDLLTDKDKMDIEFGIKHEVDYIAQSFIRNKQDILCIKQIVKKRLPRCKLIAKIENEDGIKNLNSIMNVSDGIMVARGDLGVSLPIYKIAILQKDIIKRCNRKEKLVITATQMLESMTESTRPTRAEVTDVTNAILDGTDAVMLSGETAEGKHPVLCVRMMRQIIDFTESHQL